MLILPESGISTSLSCRMVALMSPDDIVTEHPTASRESHWTRSIRPGTLVESTSSWILAYEAQRRFVSRTRIRGLKVYGAEDGCGTNCAVDGKASR